MTTPKLTVFWLIAFLLSVLLCTSSISSTWSNWRMNPVVVTYNNNPIPVGRIPFTSLTICPMTKTSAKKFNFTDMYRKMDGNRSRNLTEKELKYMQIVGQVCDDRIMPDMFDFFSSSKSNYSDDSIMSVFNELAPAFDETFVFCKLFHKWLKCHDIFHPIISSEEGLCYVFNGSNIKDIVTNGTIFDSLGKNQPPSDWLLERGYKEGNLIRDPYPHRVFGTGKQASLRVLLRIFNDDIDPLCNGGIHGFKVAFHPPNEAPQITKKYFHVSPGKLTFFTISPRFILGLPNARKYMPDVRQCYFANERKLRFFKEYTQHNCELECISNFTKRECGCVKFSYPRSIDTKICGAAKFVCSSQADSNVYRSGAFDKCKCLPGCTSISYDAETTQVDYDLVSFYSRSRSQPEFKLENSTFSSLVVSFKEEAFIPSKRSEYHSATEFLASTGGLFALYCGASLLSLFKLLYYFTLRVFFTKREQRFNRTVLPTIKCQHQVMMTNQEVPNRNQIYNLLP
ncbi:pickpocket protein 28-like [Contarinia nasturtii]|uniref:pickpocket protein 28-like n=1 Tax=Contarinia nasturtii TaxID=265458 RepID=UPI0012D42819|nr:pickpocket protein 28-like [Contarinia nasturtii]